MTKIHKDIAMHLMECAQDEEYSDQATVKVGYPMFLFLPKLHMQSCYFLLVLLT